MRGAGLLRLAALSGPGTDSRHGEERLQHPLKPKDLILGYSGCHSSFVKTFTAVAKETGVDLYRLIVEVSALNRKDPDEKLMREVAARLAQ
ncbi:hypothetical protein [Dysosmobacter sp. HCP28S3_G4]|uniref:hypothetical protein n=1 Tax=Dysosmobacter sp. HCP28S3_G4 TaxID=3438938 RepID=UPI003F8B3E7E